MRVYGVLVNISSYDGDLLLSLWTDKVDAVIAANAARSGHYKYMSISVVEIPIAHEINGRILIYS
jgi:hypothetical protein